MHKIFLHSLYFSFQFVSSLLHFAFCLTAIRLCIQSTAFACRYCIRRKSNLFSFYFSFVAFQTVYLYRAQTFCKRKWNSCSLETNRIKSDEVIFFFGKFANRVICNPTIVLYLIVAKDFE